MNSSELSPEERQRHGRELILLISVFIGSICSLIYELITGAVSSYLVGNSITQFSLVIGIFLSAMGIGSYLSKFITTRLLERFVQIEIGIGIIGGISAFLLFAAFTFTSSYYPILVLVTIILGTLVGLEIPLIIRVFEEQKETLRISVAHVMSIDYIGALAASLAFPLILLPQLGLMKASFAVGLFNLFVAFFCLYSFKSEIIAWKQNFLVAVIAAVLLFSGMIFSEQLVTLTEERIYPDEIIYAKQTPYQRIVVTKWNDDYRLFLNGNIQFSSADEYRYHESLVHVAAARLGSRERILILGGGDGMAVRECFKYGDVKEIDLVDLDAEMTSLFRDNKTLARLNNGSLNDSRVTIHNTDGWNYLRECKKYYDLIIVDLPDPENLEIGKLYTKSFYTAVAERLTTAGIMVVQATSPFFATDAFWCIANTIDAVPVRGHGDSTQTLTVLPFHTNVPSFGEWGFVMAGTRISKVISQQFDSLSLRYLTRETVPSLFLFPRDMARRSTEINYLNSQPLLNYYEKGYDSFYQ